MNTSGTFIRVIALAVLMLYVQHLWEIREAISYLSNAPLERPGKDPIPYEYGRVENNNLEQLNQQHYHEHPE